MAKHDNAGFPLLYCLLLTAMALHIQKRQNALTTWARHLCEIYDVVSKFAHTNKDMAKIGIICDTWRLKLQLYWQHIKDTIRKWLVKAEFSTLPYNAEHAHAEFLFIDKFFQPLSNTDSGEHEGGEQDNTKSINRQHEDRPNGITIQIALPFSMKQNIHSSEASSSTSILSKQPNTHINHISDAIPTLEAISTLTQTMHLPWIKLLLHRPLDKTSDTMPVKANAVASEECNVNKQHTFCPSDVQDSIINLVKGHFCTHPLILGNFTSMLKGV